MSFERFGKLHMNHYLVDRQKEGKAHLTLHHDAVCAKAFLTWCVKNDLIERNLLADYEIRRAPRPPRYMPVDEDMKRLLSAITDYWNPQKRTSARFFPVARRIFHRDRNYAIVLGLLDTACRIGEMLSLKVDDVRANERQIVIRESKGREPRTLPISPEWTAALGVWIRQRSKVMAGADVDEGWLFVNEFGGRIDESLFLRYITRVVTWAALPDAITLHSLRRFSINHLAKHNLLAAQIIAGHKETKTTLQYTKLDPDFVRTEHATVGVARNILTHRRAEPQKRRLI